MENSRQFTNLGVRLVLGLVFVVAAVAKSADLNQFAQRVGDFGLVFDAFVRPTAWTIALAEFLIGISLVLRLRYSLTAAAAFLLVFVVVLTYGMALGLDIDCGCFGPAVHVSLETRILTDLGLLLICAIIYWSDNRIRHPVAPEAPQNPGNGSRHE